MMLLVNLYLLINCAVCLCTAEPKLKLLNIVFRHGDRTPTVRSLFPTDPYYRFDFYPFGLGGLTNAGKLRAFELGKFLRDRYKNFLGDVYLPDSLYARSTDYHRTKMSLQLVLAALYPPGKLQKWHKTLDWQPIPINYVRYSDDDLLLTPYNYKFLDEKKRVVANKDIQKRIGKFNGFMNQLSNFTGLNVTNTLAIKSIYDTLLAEKYMNLTLPEWTKGIFSEGKLLDGVLLDYDIITYDDNITSALGGKLISQITDNIYEMKNTTAENMPKLYLYSGHETNVAAVLRALKVYKTHVPAYSSAVIIELLENNDEHFVKVVYYRGIPATATELVIPGCSVLCPLDKYVDTISNILDIIEVDIENDD